MTDTAATAFGGAALADPRWLADRLADSRRAWASNDNRVAGTLWWYGTSSALLAAPVTDLLATGTAPDPRLGSLTCTVRPDGSVDTVRAGATVRGPGPLAAGLRESLGAIIGALAEPAGPSAGSLWAIAADSLANRALDAGTALGSATAGSALAAMLADLIGPPMPRPRFVDVGARGPAPAAADATPAVGSRRLVRRSSCCLIYLAPAVAAPGDAEAAERAKCVSCPRQRPEIRSARLAALLG
ncbi:hypothetical protein FK531_17640 [Rhodococcus spelaei]|uniref:Ferric siderophore reductase C-terminal domain-containing protein n=1 Tax=Rhodococcus spelaei TaxID=2546320 RepID=A0A541B1X8_9NOCA|nr:hypothetical protein [Rhodococcus spelaei]TQF66332.1 hypothetical protein FK531_17640 [Rhodococcus spelaei]